MPVAYSFVGRFDEDGVHVVEEGRDDPWARYPHIDCPLCFNGAGLPPFIGGYVGYIGYDMVRGVGGASPPRSWPPGSPTPCWAGRARCWSLTT